MNGRAVSSPTLFGCGSGNRVVPEPAPMTDRLSSRHIITRTGAFFATQLNGQAPCPEGHRRREGPSRTCPSGPARSGPRRRHRPCLAPRPIPPLRHGRYPDRRYAAAPEVPGALLPASAAQAPQEAQLRGEDHHHADDLGPRRADQGSALHGGRPAPDHLLCLAHSNGILRRSSGTRPSCFSESWSTGRRRKPGLGLTVRR